MRKVILLVCALVGFGTSGAQQRWQIDKGAHSISWQVEEGDEHRDHIEMAGKRVAAVLRYGVDADGSFELNKSMVWPMLRVFPNNTHGSLMRRFDWNPLNAVTANGRSLKEQVKKITLNGTLVVESEIPLRRNSSLSMRRTYFPSVDQPALLEMYEFTDIGKGVVNL